MGKFNEKKPEIKGKGSKNARISALEIQINKLQEEVNELKKASGANVTEEDAVNKFFKAAAAATRLNETKRQVDLDEEDLKFIYESIVG